MTLKAQNLHIVRGSRTLLSGFSVAMQRGQIWALLGPNGSGKTTLLLTLCGILQPTSGRVGLDAIDIAHLPLRERALRIGVLPQRDETVFNGRLCDFVAFGGFPRGGAKREEIAAALTRMGLSALAERPLLSLSGGEYQRAHLALLMVQKADYIFLDEPLRNIDLQYQRVVLAWLRERAEAGALVVAAMHELDWVGRFCDQVCLLYDNDNPQCGPLRDTFTRDNLERLMHCTLVEIALSERVGYVPA